jgi:hypothetical protein
VQGLHGLILHVRPRMQKHAAASAPEAARAAGR